MEINEPKWMPRVLINTESSDDLKSRIRLLIENDNLRTSIKELGPTIGDVQLNEPVKLAQHPDYDARNFHLDNNIYNALIQNVNLPEAALIASDVVNRPDHYIEAPGANLKYIANLLTIVKNYDKLSALGPTYRPLPAAGNSTEERRERVAQLSSREAKVSAAARRGTAWPDPVNLGS